MRRVVLLPLLATFACHETLTIPEPPLEGMQSAILIQVDGGQVRFVHAVDVAEPSYPAFVAGEDTRLYLLRYACGLDALDLERGGQRLSDARSTLDLPAPVDLLGFDAATDEAWQTMSSMPPEVEAALLRLEVRENNLCIQRQARIEGTERSATVRDGTDLVVPTYATPLDDGSVLIGTFFSLDFSRTTTTGHSAYRLVGDDIEVAPMVKAVGPVFDAVTLDDGSLYLIGPEHLWRGRVGQGFEVVTSTSFSPTPRRMVLSASPSGAELFLAVESDLPGGPTGEFGSRRWLYELGPDGWVSRLETERERVNDRVDLQWMGPGQAVVTGFSAGGDSVHQVAAGTVTEALLGPRIRFIERVDGLGLVAGGADGTIYRRDGDAWGPLRPPQSPAFVYEVVPLAPDANAFMGWGGTGLDVNQHFEDLGGCPKEPLATGRPIDVVPHGRDRWFGLLLSNKPQTVRYAEVRLIADPRSTCEN